MTKWIVATYCFYHGKEWVRTHCSQYDTKDEAIQKAMHIIKNHTTSEKFQKNCDKRIKEKGTVQFVDLGSATHEIYVYGVSLG